MLFACVAGVSLAAAQAEPARAQSVFVSPSGNDASSGGQADPVRTLVRAQALARAAAPSMSSDITVYLRGGTYELPSTLLFDDRDSGRNGFKVVYRSYASESPVISGGRRIQSWTAVSPGLFRAAVPGWRFRQLYVNGKPAVRARTPNDGSYYRLRGWDEAGRRLSINSAEIASWNHLNEVELIVFKEWTQDNLRLGSFTTSGTEALVTPLEPDRSRAFQTHSYLRQSNQAYYFENAFEFLDQPGEFYLDTAAAQVYYRPRPGEDMTTAEVYAPALEQLVQLQGTASAPVRDIRFQGISFQHSTWTQPSAEGFSHWQADVSVIGTQTRIPAAVHLQNAERILFERCTFRNLGGSGVSLYENTRENALQGNIFEDIAAAGVSVDTSLLGTSLRDSVRNNVIRRIGQGYRSMWGIFAGYPAELTVEHNELHSLPGGGIGVGWGWTGADTSLRANLIARNHISNVLLVTEDSGGIYTLSKQPGTRIVENYIHDIPVSGLAGSWQNVNGIYLDEQSSFMSLENNVIESVLYTLYRHVSHDNTILNHVGSIRVLDAGVDTFRTDGTLDAAAVRANAGLQPSYRDLLQPPRDTLAPGAPKAFAVK